MSKTKNTYFPCPGPLKVWLKKQAEANNRSIPGEIVQILSDAKKAQEESKK